MESYSKFNHIKIHTQYSICEGALKIDELSDFCKKKRVKVLGLSDSFNLCGALEFSENISKSGTQPILGTQVNFKYKDIIGKVPLIAKSENGYKSIIQLSSKSFIENDNLEVPHCDIGELLSLSGDIIVLSGSLNSLTGKLFEKDKISEIENMYNLLKKKFENDFYIEIQRHNDFNEKNFENLNLKLSEKLKIPIIATNEVYYLEKEMHEAHDALMCIGNKTNINDQNRKKLSDQHYLKNDNELEKLFYDLPEALENNYNLVYKINFRPKASKPVLPNIGSEKGLDPKNILLEESITGLQNKIKETYNINEDNIDKNEIYQKYLIRLDHEINIIIKMEYSSYFLIVSDYIKWAKANNIPVGPGRGSGAGSLVAWCLDITDVDPIKFNLIFERFLNPDRISMPDFDIDFCEEKRDLVFEYLNTKYKNSVAHIITFGKLKARMVIRDVGRVLGFSYGFVDSISKMIPFDPSRPQSLTECINNEPRLQKLIKDDTRVKKLIELSLKLEGLNRNFATHAAGVVIADKKLTDTVPLYKDNSSNLLLPSTQFDMYSAENAGLIKFDFLGLKTLTVINNTSKMIKETDKNFDIKKINFDDQKVFKLLSSGHTVGLFQLESSGMREALMQMKPNHLEDIIALVALYRPGPMANIPTYNDCKHGNKEPDYLHPLLEEILKPTYGVIIYQEQVMQIAQKLSGFTAGEADILRRAMGKKKRQELEKQKLRFIEGAVKNGINRETAASIFLKIEPFAEYGFNKSHAAAYAIIAYQTAFLKTYYKKDFFSASMTMDISNQNKLSEFYEELKRLKIKIQRPDINKCFAEFKSKNDIFYYALGAIKNVGYEAVSNIVRERLKGGKFSSLNNFINRISPKDINKLQLEGLVKAGAFDSININRKKIYDSIPKLILKSKNTYDNKINNQINLFQTDEDDDDVLENNPDDWKFDERLSKEFSSIGFFVSDHPLNEFSEILENYKVFNFNDFKDSSDKLEANIAATVLKIQEKKTQKGNSYAIVKFSDRQSVFELFIFSDLLEINREFLKEGSSLLITVNKNVSDENNRFKKYNVKKISPLQNLINKPIENILISVHTEENLKEIDKILHKQGNTNVKIKFISETKELVFNLKNKRHIDRNHIKLLRNQGISTNII
tara:strand:- start:2436 stop:5846 length:3411 start_codon:yes stop_codon:yes gene_type:complete